MFLFALLLIILNPAAVQAAEPCQGTFAVTGEITLSPTTETAPAELTLSPSGQNASADTQTSNTASINSQTQIQPGAVIINEFLPNPETGQKEWVELLNTTTDIININGLRLEDAGGRGKNLEGLIPSRGYFVAELSSAILNNDGDTLFLKNQEIVLDQTTFGGNLIPKKGESLGRDPDGHSAAVFKISSRPTPGIKNEFPSPTEPAPEPKSEPEPEFAPESQNSPEPAAPEPEPTPNFAPNAILLSELYPIPRDGEDEWIELRNPGSVAVNLNGWKISDENNTTTELSGELAANGFFLIPKPKGKLNNAGDAVVLKSPSGVIIDQAGFAASDKIEKGESWARASNGWSKTITPTPGLANIITLPPPPPPEPAKAPQTKTDDAPIAVSPAEIHDLPLRAKIKTSGIVSMPPGIAGAHTFYIAGSGIQVYAPSFDLPELTLGDRLNIEGKVSSSGNERRILVSDPKDLVISGHEEPPTAESLAIDQIDETKSAQLIEIEGMVTQKSDDRAVLEDDSGAITVIFKPASGISLSEIAHGDRLRIRGIADSAKSGFRLIPRGKDDIQIIEKAAPTHEYGREISPATAAAGGLLSLILGITTHRAIVHRKKQKEKQQNKRPKPFIL